LNSSRVLSAAASLVTAERINIANARGGRAFLPNLEEVPHEHLAFVAGFHRRHVRQPQFEFRRADEQLLLVAEVADDECGVGAGG